jgi:hypothetical protein
MSPISGNAGSLIVPSLLRAAISINNNIKKKKKKSVCFLSFFISLIFYMSYLLSDVIDFSC